MKKYFILSLMLLLLSNIQLDAATNVSSNITHPTTWSIDGSPYYIINNIIVQSVLTINPGVEVRFLEEVEMEVTGRIIAIGTADSIIQFLPEEIHQDTRYWGRITMNHSPMNEPSHFVHCTFRYGGFSGTSPLVLKSKHIPIFHNLVFTNNRKNAITVDAEVVKYGVKLSDGGVPYTFLDNCFVEQGFDFELEPGVVLKLPGAFFLRVRGNIIANGTAEKPIVFTSFRDDEIDGKDTDNLGPSKGVAGDWGGIILEGSINHGRTGFRNCIFRFGGGSMVARQSFLFFYNSMARVDYCTFENSAGFAVSTFSDAMPDLGGGHLKSLGHNSFIGFESPKSAVSNSSNFTIPAMFNCWGKSNAADIEKIISENPGKVIFEPFLLDCTKKAPNKPQIIEPTDNSIGIDYNTIFKWTTPLFTESFRIEVSKTYDFLILHEEVRNHKDSTIKFNRFESNTIYYWRVAAENFVGAGEWSETYSFRTKDTNLPKAPQNLYPDDVVLSDCAVELSWDYVYNSDNIYEFYLRAIDDLEPLILNQIVEYSTAFQIASLPAGRQYTWQVRAWNQTGWGDWSLPAAFTTRDRFILEKLNVTNEVVKKVYSADINNDALFDIILETESSVILQKNLGNLLYEPIEVPDYRTISHLEFADFTNNNRIDFAVLGKNSDGKQLLRVLRYSGASVHTYFNFNIPHTTEILSFSIGDINNSGAKDLIIKRLTSGDVFVDVFVNTEGSFVLSNTISLYSIYKNNFAINIYDIDKNGASDIIVLSNNLEFNRRKILVINNLYTRFELNEIEFGATGNHYVIFDRMFGNKPNGYADIAVIGGDGFLIENNSGKLSPKSLLNFPSNNGKMKIIDIDYNGRNNAVANIGQSTIIHQFDYPISDTFSNFIFEDILLDDNSLHILGIIDGELYIAKNNNCRQDAPPAVPINLRHSYSGNDVILEWSLPRESIDGWDNMNFVNPKGNGITFNIRVGTSAGSYDVISSESDPLTGKLFTNKNGNAEYKYFYVLKNLNHTKYYWSVQTINEALVASLFAKEASFDFNEKNNINVPDDWHLESPLTGNYSVITIANDDTPKYNNANLETGDAIAVFLWTHDSLIFHNYAVYQAGKPFLISIMNSQIDDYVFMLYKKSDNSITFVKPIFDVIYHQFAYTKFNHNKYYISHFEKVDEFEINLQADKFSLISTPLRSYNTYLGAILPKNVTYLQNSNSKIFQIDGIRDFDRIAANEAYKAYSNSNSTIRLQGNFEMANTKTYQFNLRWNLLPFPYTKELPIEEVYGNIPFIRMVANSKGEIFYPEGNINNIGNISPGEAVKAYFSIPTAYNFPAAINADIVNIEKHETEYFTIKNRQTGSQMYLLVEYSQAQIGDEIAAISHNGEVYGAAKFIDNKAVITIWGDNHLTEQTKEGAFENEPIRLRYYSYSDAQLSNLIIGDVNSIVSYEYLSPFQFRNDFAGAVEINSESFTSISDIQAIKLKIYPNPAENYINIDYDISELNVEVEIFNSIGNLVFNGNPSNRIDISNLPIGLYLLKVGEHRAEFIKR